jgi:hypothetical protein
MANPFNPLNWLRTTQDWFAKTERSSGFRPYLIFLIIVAGISFSLLLFHGSVPGVREAALLILEATIASFIVLFAIKAFQDPNFCRSETHIERMKRLEVESMGSESNMLSAAVIEEAIPIEAPPFLPGLPDARRESDDS